MPDPAPNTAARLAPLIDRLNAGDRTAVDALIQHSVGTLHRMAKGHLRGFPQVRRWHDTDDVFQNAAIRLHRALGAVTPRSAREFFALAALQVRRELRDLARKEYGPHGRGANHATDLPAGGFDGDAVPRAEAAADDAAGPGDRAEQRELHELVDRLPADLREVVDLKVFQDLTDDDAARVLGVSESTVKRRWRDARLALGRLAGAEGQG